MSSLPEPLSFSAAVGLVATIVAYSVLAGSSSDSIHATRARIRRMVCIVGWSSWSKTFLLINFYSFPTLCMAGEYMPEEIATSIRSGKPCAVCLQTTDIRYGKQVPRSSS
ncbi:hypothetical protein C8Q74DRAFT_141359 [Fomes fomentarius]|nr:hypothetical protein C8Q74DRAFT_141359 [Fomes fomentarius]